MPPSRFNSDIREANGSPYWFDVQPRLTALGGVQKADILGGRTFAMRIWLKSDRMAGLNVSAADIRTGLAANNYLAALGGTKGSLVQARLTANTNLHTAEDFKKLVIREDKGTLIRRASGDVVWARRYDTRPVFRRARFMGIGVLPTQIHDVVKRVREMAQIQKELPTGWKAHARGTKYIDTHP